MTREELLARLRGLRQARVGQVRVPHKPLLLLWLFGQFAATGSSVASYRQAEEPVSQLINDFGPPVASPAAARQRAAMPFVHLERELWDLRDAAGTEIAPDAPERRGWLLERERWGACTLRWSSSWPIRGRWPRPFGCCWTATSRRSWPN